MSSVSRRDLPLLRHQKMTAEGMEASSFTPPDDCDLCQQKLQKRDQVARVISWRTRGEVVGREASGVTLLTAVVGVSVTRTQVSFYRATGLYFVCRGCRSSLRPGFWRALPVGLFLALAMAGGLRLLAHLEPFVASVNSYGNLLLLAGVSFLGGMAAGYASRFKNYPTTQGFALEKTSFDGWWIASSILIPLAVVGPLVLVSLPRAGWQQDDRRVEVRLARLDDPHANFLSPQLAPLQIALTELRKEVPSSPTDPGEIVFAAYSANAAHLSANYAGCLDFLHELKFTLGSCEPKPDLRDLVGQIAGESPGARLARHNERHWQPPFPTEPALTQALEALEQKYAESRPQMLNLLEQSWMSTRPKVVAQGYRLSLLDFAEAALQTPPGPAKPSKPQLTPSLATLSQNLITSPGKYLKR